jgi:hypothetical protein
MEGSLRLTSLVGVGGWRDSDLGVLCKSLNHAGIASLPDLVAKLYDHIAEIDKVDRAH